MTRERYVAVWTGGPVSDYVEGSVYVLNGRRVSSDVMVPPGSVLIDDDPPKGAAIALTIPALQATATTLTTAGLVVATAINLVLGLGLGLLASLITAPPKPARHRDEEGSPTYNLDGLTNAIRPGGPIPVIYGEHITGGQLIQTFYRVDSQGRSVLHMLLALSHGEIESIAGLRDTNDVTDIPDDIKINDVAASSFVGVSISTRMGRDDQDAMLGFRDVVQAVPFAVTLDDGVSFVYTTQTSVDAFELLFFFPIGLYDIAIGGGGATTNLTITYTVRYRISGTTTWTDPGPQTITAARRVPFSASYRVDALPIGTYEIEVTRVSPVWPDPSPDLISTMQLNAINEIRADDLAYPGVALLAIKAVASEQLSGTLPTVSAIVKGKRVWRWDGSQYVFEWTDDPVWIAHDILTNPIYGAGSRVRPQDIDLVSALAASAFMDEMVDDGRGGTIDRGSCNAVFDFVRPAWDAANDVLAPFRCGLVQIGRTIRYRVDKAEAASQLFTMGNLVAGSFRINYRSERSAANLMEVQFVNADLNYESDTVTREDAASVDTDGARPKSVALFGVTHPSRAARAATYLLNVERMLGKSCTFRVPLDSLAVEPGDVIALQVDFPSWGVGGRVVESPASDNIFLDREVSVVQNVTKITIRTDGAGESIQTRTVISPTGTYTAQDQIDIDPPWTDTPKAGDPYAIGAESTHITYWRVVSITRAEDLTAELECIEYDASVFDDDPGTVEEFTDVLRDPRHAIEPDNVSVSEQVELAPDGSRVSSVRVSWWPDDGVVDVYRRRMDEDGWTWVASGCGGYAVVREPMDRWTGYEFSVVSRPAHWGGVRLMPDRGKRASLSMTGWRGQPDSVAGLRADVADRIVHLRWTPGDNVVYEIRRGAATWLGSRVESIVDACYYSAPVDWTGDETWHVRAKDRTGNLSDAPATVTVTSPLVAASSQSEAPSWSGTKTGTSVVSGDLEGAGSYVAQITAPSLSRWRVTARCVSGVRDISADMTRALYGMTSDHANRLDMSDTSPADGSEYREAWNLGDYYESISGLGPSMAEMNGPPPDVASLARIKIEFRTSDDAGSTWTDWGSSPVAEFDKAEVRVMLAAPSGVTPFLDALDIAVVPVDSELRVVHLETFGSGGSMDPNTGTIVATTQSVAHATDRDGHYTHMGNFLDGQNSAVHFGFCVPPNMDTTKPVSTRCVFAVGASGSGDAEIVQTWRARADAEDADTGGISDTHAADLVTTSYAAGSFAMLDMGVSIAGSRLTNGDYVSGTISREARSSNANDTSTATLRLVAIEFRGYLR